MQEFINSAVDLSTQAGGKVILALVVFIVGRIVINKVMAFIGKGKALSKIDPTAASFFKNAIRTALYVILVVSIISILGVPMASVVAVIASCGVAVGLALQGALGNLAGGIMLLIFRPFAVGDYKRLPNEVGGQQTVFPEDVRREMKALLHDYNLKKHHSFEDILDFHVQFESIHPFQDGNGRIGRLVMFKECLGSGIVPFIITDELKLFYYRGLREWGHVNGYLIDTCLTAQDQYKTALDYFRIKY